MQCRNGANTSLLKAREALPQYINNLSITLSRIALNLFSMAIFFLKCSVHNVGYNLMDKLEHIAIQDHRVATME